MSAKIAAPVTPEALAFYTAAQRTMENLWERWQDEKQYEAIEDYRLPLVAVAEKAGVTLGAMTKRPFGVKFSVGGKEFHLTITRQKYAYTRTV